LVAALAAWCLWYKPWETHYQGLPSSYWAGVLLAKDREARARGTGGGSPTGFLAGILQRLSAGLAGESEFEGRESERVLEELLHHTDADVRRVAAVRLHIVGSKYYRQALPILIEGLRPSSDRGLRENMAKMIFLTAYSDANAVRPHIADLLQYHEAETSQSVRNVIVQTLRKLDPKSADWPPIVQEFSFDKSHPGGDGFFGWQTEYKSERLGALWTTVADATAPSRYGCVLAQTEGSGLPFIHRFLFRESGMTNLSLRVAIKAVAGPAEQGGGVLWRHNLRLGDYYAAGISSRDGSLRLYRAVAGDRDQLAASEGLKLAIGEWHELCVKHVGDRIECWLDGTKYIEVTDATIRQGGQIGLWTKTDAQTYFDGLRATDYGPAWKP
jgi:hypothetical protein